ncbi:MAG TPA: redoxin domain-containing protein [Nitrososphaeraceae archaeon]|jgi:peroxiredoxin
MSDKENKGLAIVGNQAPEFELPDTDMHMHKLSEIRGTKTVLAFFPAAESPVCTKEMCEFKDSLSELQSVGATIIGISVDGPFANKIFSLNRNLNFPILSDYKREAISMYGIVMKDLGPLTDYYAAKRSIFILDKEGKITYRWISDNPLIEPDYDLIKTELNKM